MTLLNMVALPACYTAVSAVVAKLILVLIRDAIDHPVTRTGEIKL